MASLLDALATGAKNRVASTTKDAKESAMNQFDPRKTIYGLGMGVGPLIRETVAEYKKQQGKSSEKDNKKTAKDIVDIKTMTSSSKNSLSKIDAQFRAMNNILGDIRKINIAQLQALKGTSSNVRQNTSVSNFGGVSSSESLARDESTLSKLGKWLSTNFPGAMATAAGGVAVGVAYKHKDEIKQALEDYLQGAGLPNSSELKKQAAIQLEQTSKTIANNISSAVSTGVQQAVMGLPELILSTWKKNLKLAVGMGTDEEGRPIPQDKRPLASQVGGGLGASLGLKYAPGFFKIPAAAAGYVAGQYLGEEAPEATLSGAALAMGGYGAYKLRQAATAKAAAKATEAAQAAQAAAATRAAATPPNMPTQPWQVPSGSPASNVRMSPGGIIIPEASGARSAEAAKNMADAASRTLTATDKAGVAARNTVSSLAKYGREATAIVSKYGKGMVGLSALFSLPDIYDDIKDGDYAAAGVRAATLIGSTAIGLTGFFSAGAGFVAGTGVSIGGNMAADALKAPKVNSAGGSNDANPQITPNDRPSGTDRMAQAAREEIEKAQRGKKTSASQQDMMKIIEEEFRAAGYTDVQIKAAQIAAAAESGLDPYASGDNGASIGLFQLNRLKGEGRGFTVEQLSDPRQNAMIAADKMRGKQGNAFRNASTLDDALMAWVRDFERPFFVGGGGIKDMNEYNKYISRGAKIAGNPSDVISTSVTSAMSSSGSSSSSSGVDVSKLRSLGMSTQQIENLTGFQETIKGFNDLSNIFTGNFDKAPGAIEAAPQPNPGGKPSGGGNSNRSAPSVPPVSLYKEKHSFGQPWYKTGGAPPMYD